MNEGSLNHMAFLSDEQFFDYSETRMISVSPSIPETQNIPNLRKMHSQDYLVAFSAQSHSYCVGCVDMVNSTKISASIPAKKLSSYYEIFLNSMSKIIGKFDGKVIKNVGDCLMFYFPKSKDSVNSGFEDCINCGLTMIDAQKIICEKLSDLQLPCLSYRISADYGFVIIMNTTDSSTMDMIGSPVNMCTKINRCAKPNEFVIGGDLYERVKKFRKFRLEPVKSCSIGFKQPYPVYRIR